MTCQQKKLFVATSNSLEPRARASHATSLCASGIKISITGDLWSENGMGLFGIYAHGMPEFKMEKALIALIACESEVRLPCCCCCACHVH